MFNEQDTYLIKTVLSDLNYLREEWDQNIDNDSLRITSPILRRLLVEDQFGRAWRMLGLEKQPLIDAPDLERSIRDIPIDGIVFAQAGGATFQGQMMELGLVLNFIMTPEQRKADFERGQYALTSTFGLSEFLDSMCFVISVRMRNTIQSMVINRRELIQYVANKIGGVHLDLTRDLNKDLDNKFKILDDFRDNPPVQFGNKKPVYFELLSIGQAVAKAEDVSKFVTQAKSVC